MLTKEEIAQKIFERTLEVNEALGDDAGIIFLSGVSFGAELAMGLVQDAEELKSSMEELNEYYSNITKGEVN